MSGFLIADEPPERKLTQQEREELQRREKEQGSKKVNWKKQDQEEEAKSYQEANYTFVLDALEAQKPKRKSVSVDHGKLLDMLVNGSDREKASARYQLRMEKRSRLSFYSAPKHNDNASKQAKAADNQQVVLSAFPDLNISERLSQAAQAGDMDQVKTCVELGVDLRAEVNSRKQETALHLAIVSGQTEVATFLVENGANTNAANKFGATPLHCAAEQCNEDVALLLLNKNANPFAATARVIRAWSWLVDGCVSKRLYTCLRTCRHVPRATQKHTRNRPRIRLATPRFTSRRGHRQGRG